MQKEEPTKNEVNNKNENSPCNTQKCKENQCENKDQNNKVTQKGCGHKHSHQDPCCKEKSSNNKSEKKEKKEISGYIQRQREEAKEKRRRAKPPKNLCFKCKKAVPTFKYRNGLKCSKECFKGKIVEAKFRSSLRTDLGIKGRNKDSKNRILILLSGGLNSVCVAFMASESLHNNTFSKRKMFFEAEMLHIDESCFYKDEIETGVAEANLALLQKFAEDIEIKLNVVKVEDFGGFDRSQGTELLQKTSNKGSCREDLIRILRNRAILKFCKENGFKKLVTGENGLRAASNAFNALLKGRGKELLEETGASSAFMGDPEITIARPIKEFLPREMNYYLKVCNLGEYVITRKNLCLNTKGKTASLPGRGNFTFVIDSFLSNLQKNYPSTIHTVLKTCERVKLKPEYREEKKHCPMCLKKKDGTLLLEVGFGKELIGLNQEKMNSGWLQDEYERTRGEHEKALCYGCKKIVDNSDKNELLSSFPLDMKGIEVGGVEVADDDDAGMM